MFDLLKLRAGNASTPASFIIGLNKIVNDLIIDLRKERERNRRLVAAIRKLTKKTYNPKEPTMTTTEAKAEVTSEQPGVPLKSQAEQEASELAYLRGLDKLRQEAGITAAMLRDGRAKQMAAMYSEPQSSILLDDLRQAWRSAVRAFNACENEGKKDNKMTAIVCQLSQELEFAESQQHDAEDADCTVYPVWPDTPDSTEVERLKGELGEAASGSPGLSRDVVDRIVTTLQAATAAKNKTFVDECQVSDEHFLTAAEMVAAINSIAAPSQSPAAVAFIHELAAKEQAAKQSAPVHQRDDHNEALCPVCTPPQPEPFPATTVRCWVSESGTVRAMHSEESGLCLIVSRAGIYDSSYSMSQLASAPWATEIPPATAHADMLTTFPEGAARLMELCREHRVEEKTVMQMLVERKPSPFHPAPRYYSEGDFLTYFLSPAKSLGTQVSESLVLYHDQESGRLTGFRLNGVAELLSQAANTSQCKQSAPLPTIGPQRAAPATVAQIQAQVKQAERMALCPTCGNKRCPKAEWHGYACTGSNAPGQVGILEQPATPQPAVDGAEITVVDLVAIVKASSPDYVLRKWQKKVRKLERRIARDKESDERRARGSKAIWDSLQEIAPWEASNDMEWADEILCGIALARDRIRELESQLAAALQTGDMLLEAAAQRQAKANQLESQLAAQSPQWITYTGQELEPGVWYSEATESVFALPMRGMRLLLDCRYCRIGSLPTKESEADDE